MTDYTARTTTNGFIHGVQSTVDRPTDGSEVLSTGCLSFTSLTQSPRQTPTHLATNQQDHLPRIRLSYVHPAASSSHYE